MPDYSKHRKERRDAIAHDDEDDPFPGVSEEGPHVRIRDVFTSHHTDYAHGVPVDVTHYIQDKSIRHRLVLLSLSNSKLGIRLLLVRAVFLLVGCLLYVAETAYFDYFTKSRGAVSLLNSSLLPSDNNTAEVISMEARALVLLVEEKPYPLWVLQVLLAVVILFYAVVTIYASPNLVKTVDVALVFMLLIPLLYLFTLLYPPVLRSLFVPAFFYCWPAGQSFTTAIVQALQRSSAQFRVNTFRLRAVSLVVLFTCFVFSWTCILHHFFRIDEPRTLFETYYFMLVTMSTVGYGDISPNHWTGQFLVTVFIFSAIVYLIPQLHDLYEAFTLQQQLNNTVGFKDVGRKHILICSQALKPLVLRDFLTEFYSDPTNYEVHSVLLVEKELNVISQIYLRHPIWAKRITVLIGTPLKLSDLIRARAQSALACFIHTPRDQPNSQQADQYSIMCAWAIKDFAPKVKLHVQILRPDNKAHLEIADHVVCEGELKNALLAANSVCPGITTLVTLLLHTFKPEQRPLFSEEYRLYSQCAPCEIYDCRLGDSKFFHHFIGKNFLYTAVVAFRKYHVTLLAVHSSQQDQTLLNPGLDYIMEEDDICYYIGFTREEYTKVGGATSINHALQQMCAKQAIHCLALVGIDPYSLNERVTQPHRQGSVSSLESNDGPKPNVSFFISEPSGSELSLESIHINVPDPDLHEVRRGLHLLRFHSSLDMHANPVVRVNLVGQQNSQHPSSESMKQDGGSIDSHDHHVPSQLLHVSSSGHHPSSHDHHVPSQLHRVSSSGHHLSLHDHHVPSSGHHVPSHEVVKIEPDIGYGRQTSEPHLQVPKLHHHVHRQLSEPHDGRRRLSEPHLQVPKLHHHVHRQLSEPHEARRRLSGSHDHLRQPLALKGEHLPIIKESTADMQRSFSDNTMDPSHSVLYSSKLSLVNPLNKSSESIHHPPPHHHSRLSRVRPSLWSTITQSSAKSSMADVSECVELDLEDIEEEEELEELEDGLCEEPSTSEERSPSPTEPGHQHKYNRGPLPNTPYLGLESQKYHLLHEKRCHDDVLLKAVSTDFDIGLCILYSALVTDDLYHFILPLRAEHLPSSSLKPLVLMLNCSPPDEFLDVIAWLPLVYCLTGDVENINHWLLAGITLAHNVVILSAPVSPHHHDADQHEHLADSAHIMAVQRLAKLFPQVSIVTELHYRYNIRFMRFTDCDRHFNGSLTALMRKGDHLTYLFVPQFAGGRVFCPSMLDTLLYQAHIKPYIIELVRQLLGCKQMTGSGYLWHVPLTAELLGLGTYERVFQRLVSQYRYIPIGIHRTVPGGTCPELLCEELEPPPGANSVMDRENVSMFLKSRMETLGLSGLTEPASNEVEYRSFVLPNPPPKTILKQYDIILVIHPYHSNHPPPQAHTQTQPSHSTPTRTPPSQSACGQGPVSEQGPIKLTVPIECHDHWSETPL